MRKHVFEPRVIDISDAVAGKSAFIVSPEFFAWIKKAWLTTVRLSNVTKSVDAKRAPKDTADNSSSWGNAE